VFRSIIGIVDGNKLAFGLLIANIKGIGFALTAGNTIGIDDSQVAARVGVLDFFEQLGTVIR